MTLALPTLSTILTQIQNDINSRLTGSDSTLTASVLNVIANVLAGVAFSEYQFIGFVAAQVFPDTAQADFLHEWGGIWGVTPKSATPATGNITVTGTSGVSIPSGTEFQRADNALFKSTSTVVVGGGGTIAVPVTAEVAGFASNTIAGASMAFVSPIAFVNAACVVDGSGLNGGDDLESDILFEPRLLKRIQNPPQGGSATDYVEWALQVAGVTRAWSYAQELGIGTVSVRFMMDNNYSDGIPLSGDVTTVQNYINVLKPVTADVTVVAPIANVLNFTIHLNIADTAAIRASVQANLEELIINDAVPGGTIYLSRINAAISAATGQYDHTLSVPSANVTNTTGHISTMGTITWT